jgi:hypothetical protein
MKIVVVGDSYTYGQGCSDRNTHVDDYKKIGSSNYCWTSLLQQRYPALEVKNYGKPGIDNINMAKVLHQQLQENIKLIVFCSTFTSRVPVRHPYAENYITLTISPHWQHHLNEPGFDESITKYFKHLYSDIVGHDIMTNSLLSAYGTAKLIGADFLWNRPTQPQHESNNQIIDWLKHYEFKSMPDFDYMADELAPCGHPNNNGHARYFKEIITPLIDNFLQDHNGH